MKPGAVQFDDWSFFEQYKSQNRVRSDIEFKYEATGSVYELTNEQKARAKALSIKPLKWRRPKAEDVAKSMNLTFLYKYGYDYGSTHVHPMANDGEQDFFTITKFKPVHEQPDQTSLLSNSILANSVFLQEALNASSFKWRQVLWTYLEQVRGFLEDGSDSYEVSFIKLARFFKEAELCEKST